MPPQQRPPPLLSFSTLPLSHQYPFPPTNGDFCQTLSLATRVSSCLLVLHTPFLQFLILCHRLSSYFVPHLSVTLLPQFPLSPPQELLPCSSLASTSVSLQPLTHAPDPRPPGSALPDCSRVSAPRRRRPSSSRSHCSAIRARRSPATARETAPRSPDHAPRARPRPRPAPPRPLAEDLGFLGAVRGRVTCLSACH